MPTTIALAEALRLGCTRAGVPALLAQLGFQTPEEPDARTRRALGVPEDISRARVARGSGALRAVWLDATPDHPARETLLRIARGMASRAPHLLWLLVVSWPERAELAIATWTAVLPPTVVSLLVQRDHVTESDAESFGALVSAVSGDDVVVHGRWREILGREMLSRRFYRALERGVLRLAEGAKGVAPMEARRELALLTTSRLLFLAFLESRGWLDGDRGFLARTLDDCLRRGGRVHQRLLAPLFFGTLNTRVSRRAPAARAFGRIPFLNGGLFQRTALESRWRALRFGDDDLAALGDEVLFRYRFTPREDDGRWSELAIDPEMLGRSFESLMASTERRASGTFYTPQPLVERVTEAAFRDALSHRGADVDAVEAAMRGTPLSSAAAATLRAAVGELRVLDPACGSGAFLVHALERLSLLTRLAGDPRSETERRRFLVARCIFGLDVHPTAVWLCELRLWLAVVLDCNAHDPMSVPPLPNLDHNVRVGDALRSPGFDIVLGDGGSISSQRLHARYAAATGARKRALARQLHRQERSRAEQVIAAALSSVTSQRRELLAAARGPDLFGGRRGSLGDEGEALAALRAQSRAWRRRMRDVRHGRAVPFSFPSHFPHAAANGGFDVVVGNPPWVRLHRIPADVRPELRRAYRVFREAAWERGAADARAGRGFAAQVDLAALFAERAVQLARDGGSVSLLLPAKLWHSLAGGGVRRLCADWNTLQVLEDWSEAPSTFDAAVYPSLVVVRRGMHPASPLTLGLHRRDLAISWRTERSHLPLDDSPGAPWLILPPAARAAFDHLTKAGIPLGESGIGHPTLGLKSGCNEAFLVRVLERSRGEALVSDGSRRGRLESALLRPVLRGESTSPWRATASDEHIVFPLRPGGAPLTDLPPGVRAWLAPWRRTLMKRSDARHGTPWWSLFRTEGAFSDRPRVVWADLARAPGAVVLEAGDLTVPLNSCYVLRCRDLVDAFAFSAWLNSPLAAAWLGSIAEPARGGYRRFLAWTVTRLPIPKDWARGRDILAPLGERASRGERVTKTELLDASVRAFRLRASHLLELLAWDHR